MAAAAASVAGEPVQVSVAAPGRLAAQGALTFASARRAAELGNAAIAGAAAGPLIIDCAGIGSCDSAGLAVLLEWLGIARGRGRALRYENLPSGVRALARISDLEELLTRGV
jgi:phospholipid transport system transporter-binding protein